MSMRSNVFTKFNINSSVLPPAIPPPYSLRVSWVITPSHRSPGHTKTPGLSSTKHSYNTKSSYQPKICFTVRMLINFVSTRTLSISKNSSNTEEDEGIRRAVCVERSWNLESSEGARTRWVRNRRETVRFYSDFPNRRIDFVISPAGYLRRFIHG